MQRIVVGVDLAAGRGVTAMATLRLTTAGPAAPAALSLLRLARLADDDAILAEVVRVTPCMIGLDAPLSLPAQVAAALRGESPSDSASPYTRAAERDPIWSRLGVRPFPVSFLGGLTFRAIPLAARLRAEAPTAQIIEVFPSATAVALALGAQTPPDQRRPPKTAPERRRAIQGALAGLVGGLAPAADDTQPLDADSLDAILAALTCAASALGAAQAIGDPTEGCIMLPSPNVSDLFTASDATSTTQQPRP